MSEEEGSWQATHPVLASKAAERTPEEDAGYCLICYYFRAGGSLPAEFFIGFSCMISMETFVYGYCHEHLEQVLKLVETGEMRCDCTIGHDAHDFEEIFVHTQVN